MSFAPSDLAVDDSVKGFGSAANEPEGHGAHSFCAVWLLNCPAPHGRQSSTLRAHRLIRWLDSTLGWERAEVAYAHLSRAHFVERGLLNDMAVLEGAAAAVGIEPEATRAYLSSDEGTAAILSITHELHRLGVHSIPTLFVNGKPALDGAAGVAEVLAALREAAQEPHGRRRFLQ